MEKEWKQSSSIYGKWSNGDPVHIITDGVNRRVAANFHGSEWVESFLKNPEAGSN